jgi:hypothetical protein
MNVSKFIITFDKELDRELLLEQLRDYPDELRKYLKTVKKCRRH